MKLDSSFSFKKISYETPTTAFLLVSATAPKLDASARRLPLSLVVALDTSTSMRGEKLAYVQKSAYKLIENLTSEDTLSLLSFDSYVRVLVEPMLMTSDNKRLAREAISRLVSTGCTNLSGALHEGFRLGEKQALSKSTRFILLTDGEPTVGETNYERLLDFAQKSVSDTVSLTTFGYGRDVKSEFLNDLAAKCRGNYAFVETPDDALSAFGRELGGLLSCYAQNLNFKITPKPGVEIVKVWSDVDVKEYERGVEITVPDLYSEEPRHLVLEVKIPAQFSSLPRPITLVDISLNFLDLQAGHTKQATDKTKVSFVRAEDADKAPVKAVMEQVTLAKLIDAQKRAEEEARRGRFEAARTITRGVDMTYAAPAAFAYCSTLDNAFASSASYATNAADLSATKSAFRTGKLSGVSANSVRTGATIGTSNSMQEAMIRSFTGDQPASVDVVVDQTVTTSTTTTKSSLTKTKSSSDW